MPSPVPDAYYRDTPLAPWAGASARCPSPGHALAIPLRELTLERAAQPVVQAAIGRRPGQIAGQEAQVELLAEDRFRGALRAELAPERTRELTVL